MQLIFILVFANNYVEFMKKRTLKTIDIVIVVLIT